MVIDLDVSSVESRPADHREPNVKKGGKAYGVVAIPSFWVVTCHTDSGSADLVVPAADAPLVKTFFSELGRANPDR